MNPFKWILCLFTDHSIPVEGSFYPERFETVRCTKCGRDRRPALLKLHAEARRRRSQG